VSAAAPAAGGPPGLGAAPPAGLLRTLSRHWGFRVGALLAVMLTALAVLGPFFAHGPNVTDYADQLAPPSSLHWLGTDGDGRDEFARTVAGARTTLGAAMLVFALTTVIGIAVGTATGFLGGIFDTCVSRLIDLLLGLPSLVLALAVVGALGPGFSHLILAMTITGWAGLAKLARTYTVGARGRPDVTAARMAGVRTSRILAGHVLPGAGVAALIAATLGLGDTILGLAGLSFLGLGVQPPVSEWGSMLNDSQLYLTVAPWLVIGPGLGIIGAVTAATLISDALRDCTDPGRG
jgi:ABC-type dipeptide/oligopeptide/nickel transport system permease subunit